MENPKILEYKPDKIMIFIDGSNLYYSLKDNCSSIKINFLKFSELLAKQQYGKHVRTYYYNSPLTQEDNEENYKSQQRFFNAIKRMPNFELVLGRREKRTKGEHSFSVEKGVDIAIATDMVRLAYNNAYDIAILVSGDGDFVRAVKLVKEFGKKVVNAYFKKGHSKFLLDEVDDRIALTEELLKDCF